MGDEKKTFLRRQVCQVAATPQQEAVDTAGCHPERLPTRSSGYISALGGSTFRHSEVQTIPVGKEGTSSEKIWWLELPSLQFAKLCIKVMKSQMLLSQRREYASAPQPTWHLYKRNKKELLKGTVDLTEFKWSPDCSLCCLTSILAEWKKCFGSMASCPHTLWVSALVLAAPPTRAHGSCFCMWWQLRARDLLHAAWIYWV